MKLLVAIASYGTGNDHHLARLIQEYRSMPFETDIVVVSNIQKEVGPGVKLQVGLPAKNPWSLPFAHRRIFAERAANYDLFVYSEDDILITEKNIRAFLDACSVLPEEKLAGFFRVEFGPDGKKYYPEVHHRHHWDPHSIKTEGPYTWAFFTSEHAACYALTRAQLQRTIASGGYMVAPHDEDRYDMLCAAATDPYTQCGFQKVICISHFSDFLVHHLPNKYLDKMGMAGVEVDRQIGAMLKIGKNGCQPWSLLGPKIDSMPLPFATRYAKNYYEPTRTEILSLVPQSAQNILSLGCGWGEAEHHLARQGARVTAVPLDPVISSSAEARGVRIVCGDFEEARKKLTGEQFDCLYVTNILHLVEDPTGLLSTFSSLLAADAAVVTLVPNPRQLQTQWRLWRRGRSLRDWIDFEKSGIHSVSSRALRKWFQRSGIHLEKTMRILPQRAQKIQGIGLGWLEEWLAPEIVAVGKRYAS